MAVGRIIYRCYKRDVRAAQQNGWFGDIIHLKQKRGMWMKTKKRFSQARITFKKNREMLLMTMPVIIKTLIFSYLPMIGIILAFKNYTPRLGIFGSEWVGIKNFEFFFRSHEAVNILRNTVVISAINIVSSMLINVVLALILYEVSSRIMLKFYQTVLFIPHFFSWVLVGLMLTALINQSSGFLTNILVDLTGNKINFYAKPGYWVAILPIINAWKGAGFGSLIYYSVLMSIDKELFEAAEIDGASKMQRIMNISIPHLKSMFMVLLIINMGSIIKTDFGLFYYVTRNSPQLYEWTDTIDTYVFRALTENSNFTMSSAVTLFQNAVGCIMLILTNKLAKRYDKDYALF